jgi:hypothetical protein
VATIVYDTGALLAAERRNPDFLALHDELTAAPIRPIVPVVVLTQAWRGGPLTTSSARPCSRSPKGLAECGTAAMLATTQARLITQRERDSQGNATPSAGYELLTAMATEREATRRSSILGRSRNIHRRAGRCWRRRVGVEQ